MVILLAAVWNHKYHSYISVDAVSILVKVEFLFSSLWKVITIVRSFLLRKGKWAVTRILMMP